MDSPLKQPAVDLTEEAEECDPHEAGTHSPVHLLKKRNHYHSLPVQRQHSPETSGYLRNSRRISSTPGAWPSVMGKSSPWSPVSDSSMEAVLLGSNYSSALHLL